MNQAPEATADDSELRSGVSIGIVTKNRWEDLGKTLARLAEAGLDGLPLHLVDDGSNDARPDAASGWGGPLDYVRRERSEGYIVHRNAIARRARTPYLLSLDDDSFPAGAGLGAALGFAASRSDLLCLSFPIYNPADGVFQSASQHSEPYPVRAFIGCGHLMHLPAFLRLGGYREELLHQGEEMDVAARGLMEGLRCFHYPALTVHHTASNRGRDWSRMDYFGSRNALLWNDWYAPSNLRAGQQIKTFLGRSLLLLRLRRRSLWDGQLAGLRDARRLRALRRPFSPALYHVWRSLPPH